MWPSLSKGGLEMKIRYDFVTNSSSTSYVVFDKTTPKCEMCKKLKKRIFETLLNSPDSDISAKGKDEVLEWLTEEDYETIMMILKILASLYRVSGFGIIAIIGVISTIYIFGRKRR